MQRLIQGKNAFGKYVSYKGNLTRSLLLKHFSCQLTSPAKLLEESHGEAMIVAESFLLGADQEESIRDKIPNDKRCVGRVRPMRILYNKSNFVVLDFENARFSKDTFWALPIIAIDTSEKLVWSKTVLHTLDLTQGLVLISNIKEKYFPKFPFSPGSSYLDSKRNVPVPSTTFSRIISSVNLSPLTKKDLYSWMQFLKLKHLRNKPVAQSRLQNGKSILQLYNATCSSFGADVQLGEPWVQFRTIILVVLFNNPFYSVIPYLELLYRPFFPSIIYCMPKTDTSDTHYGRNHKYNVTILYYKNSMQTPGATNYICGHMVKNLGLEAEGYFFISDDILVSLSLLKDLPLQVPAISLRYPPACDGQRPTFRNCNRWQYFKKSSAALKSLNRKYENQSNSLPYRCLQKIRNTTGYALPVLHALADIYYIPNSYMQEASILFKVFHEHRVFLEATVKYVLTCLTLPQHPIEMQGHHDWSATRLLFFKSVHLITSEKNAYLHPAKLSFLEKGIDSYVDSFCRDLIPYLHKGY